MSLLELSCLALSAVAAGAINAVAGGGTLVTFPMLLFFGMSPVAANATSTFALLVGTSGSVFGYRRHLGPVKPWLWRFVPVSLLGGLLGSLLLVRTDERLFANLVPFLILFATLLFMTQGFFRRLAGLDAAARPARPPHLLAAVLFQFGVAVYGGYFGAGIGILMLATLGFVGLTHIHEMNALKTVLGGLINLVAAALFVANGLVDWPRALVMTAGAVAGYWLGAHCAQRIPQARVRLLITGIGFTLAAATFYQQFAG